MQHILRIIGIALHYKSRLIAAYLCTAGALVAYVLLPYLFGEAIDDIASHLRAGEGSVPSSAILTSVAIIMSLGVIRGVLSYGQTYLGESLSQYVSYEIRNSFYDHVQHQSFAFHDRYHTGNLMSRAITDVENIRMFINMGLVRAPYFAILFVVVAGILIYSDWKLGLLSASFMPVVAFYTSSVRLKMRALWLQVQEKMAELSTILQENFSGMRVVKAFASEDHEEARFDAKSSEVADIYIQAERLRASSTSFMLFTFLVAMGLILWYGGYQVINGHMTPGELAQFIFYLQILAMPVRMSGWLVNSYARAASAGQRMFEILDTVSPVKELKDAVDIPRPKGHVQFENVSFAYEGRKPVLTNVSIDAKPGEVIALLGAPGSGKSTIVSLLPRFYDVTEGRITIDGVDIKEYTLKSLRNNVGVVQQDVFLFTTSLKENIAYGREHAAEEEIRQSASVAQMSEFIESLDEGYETLVGERGSTLSGGQRQRMSIARALLLDPPILILDDSTSSVDAQTEDDIRKAMESVMRGRTTFVIANRLSTVHMADKIIVLENGEIAEEGTHKELLSKSGHYREIYELQLMPQDEVLREINVPTGTSSKKATV
ncbi:MAG: ABC transporter ATP-binding protein [SAR202 cluster bacterium]|jgi:ATP-binding cassette subfamily B protein|nr:ABC transporter ATP-binding protein [SAR202 cluster bacterium]